MTPELNGTAFVQVKRSVTLHEGHRDVSVHAWDSQGHKMTATVRLLYQRQDPQAMEQHRPEADTVPEVGLTLALLGFMRTVETKDASTDLLMPLLSLGV